MRSRDNAALFIKSMPNGDSWNGTGPWNQHTGAMKNPNQFWVRDQEVHTVPLLPDIRTTPRGFIPILTPRTNCSFLFFVRAFRKVLHFCACYSKLGMMIRRPSHRSYRGPWSKTFVPVCSQEAFFPEQMTVGVKPLLQAIKEDHLTQGPKAFGPREMVSGLVSNSRCPLLEVVVGILTQ